MPAKPPKDLPHDPDTGEQVRGPSTIYGNWRRGTGVLNNELYIGRLVWNRLRYLKGPDSGKRASRLSPESEWIVKDVPELRIVDDGLWKQVKARQQAVREVHKHLKECNSLGARKRPLATSSSVKNPC